MKTRDPEFFDRSMQQLANDLGVPKAEVLNKPLIEVARMMGRRGVSVGLRAVQ